jgi:hypothetical protein
MTAAPTVSAIIPVYNGQRYVAESIRSVLAQSRPVAECIVVDDGSTDGTADVLASFGSSIVVVRQDHAGVSAARNAGMATAIGDCFAFLDADDVWFPGKTEAQVAVLQAEHDAGAVYSGFVVTDEHLQARRLIIHSGGQLSVKRAFLGYSGGLGFSFTGIVRRDAAEAAGGYDERLSNCADVDFWWRVSRMRPVVGVRRPLAFYRQHPYGQMHLDFHRAAEELDRVWASADTTVLPRHWARRSMARREAHRGCHLLCQGRMVSGSKHLRRAAKFDGWALATVPVRSLCRMTVQTLAASAWPLFVAASGDRHATATSPAEPAAKSPYASLQRGARRI